MIHVIEIREIVGGTKPGTVKFKSTANLTYNCNKEEFNGHWAVGEKYKIDFNVSSFQGSRGTVEMKWVNNARFWKDGDGPVDPAEKPVYQGGGGSYSGGGNKGGGMKKDYDPITSMRQTAANCAMQYLAASGCTIDELDGNFATVANIVLKYVQGPGAAKSDDAVADSGSEEGAGGNTGDEDIPF